MKRKVIVLLSAVYYVLIPLGSLYAQVGNEEDFLGDEFQDEFLDQDEQKRIEEERKKREEAEKKLREEEARRVEEAKRATAQRKALREEKAAKAKIKELDALREASADSTEYTLNPSSVELVVEMDPNGYGFRSRTHRMTISADVDLLFRGRGMLHYDYRFFNYLSIGAQAGVDWSDISLYSRFLESVSTRSAKQFSILGGLSAKWRLTEWYLHSAAFLEPSLLFGHMWQTLVTQKTTTHWRLRPGLFGGIETVFDSGFAMTTRLGVEFPLDFGAPNPIKEVAQPLLVFGFGFAI